MTTGTDATHAGGLLDPSFLARLDRLRLKASRRRRVRGARAGLHRSPRHALSPEVAEHRPYATGDDPRRIDWNAYARLGELVVRLTVAEDERRVHLLLDASRSLGFGAPTKLDVAARLLGAVGYLALSSGEQVAVSAFAGAEAHALPPRRGRRGAGSLLRFLGDVAPEGGAHLGDLVDVWLARSPRRGLAVLATDLLDPSGFAPALDRIVGAGHELWLFHVLARSDLAPDLPPGADVVVVDSETGDEVTVAWDDAAQRAHAHAVAEFQEDVDAWARRRGVPVLTVVGEDGPFDEGLLRYLGDR